MNEDTRIGHWLCVENSKCVQHVFPEGRKICNCGKYIKNEEGKLVLNKEFKGSKVVGTKETNK